jgi:hypothetical protein
MRELMRGINYWSNVGLGSGLFYAIFFTTSSYVFGGKPEDSRSGVAEGSQ